MVPIAIYNNLRDAITHIESATGDHTTEEITIFDSYADFCNGTHNDV